MEYGTRRVGFETCFNFRDLGGYPTADGRRVRLDCLYRSDSLHRLSEADRAAFGALGVRTVVDLRSEAELTDHGVLHDDARAEVAWHHVPLFDLEIQLRPRAQEQIDAEHAATSKPGDAYVYMLGDGVGAARAFDLLTAPGAWPAVFHCTAGKDRTGMLAAMLLEVLGVDDDVIVHDYVQTNDTLEAATAWVAENEPEFAEYLKQIPMEHRLCTPDKIIGFLSGVRDRWGSVEGLLQAQGIDDARLSELRRELVAEA